MLLYVLDLFGVAVFAVSGALSAGQAGLDWLGVAVIATLTAIGGGTLRDLMINRHPVFWMADTRYLYVALIAALLTVLLAVPLGLTRDALLVVDALGLAVFALLGAEVAEERRLAPILVVILGTMTGVVGGVMRDLLSNEVPLLLRQDIYALAAIAGICLYLLLQRFGLPRAVAFWSGLLCVMAIRLLAIAYAWHLPVFSLPQA